METKWTKEQLQAITARKSNLLVAAAAGSGKTAVLVERIIQMITKDGIDIDSLLVVTFTNAAAAEMRERIGEAIIKALEKNPENKNLERQLSLLNRSSITTIHSFCLEIIRNNFQEIGLDPGFRITDETERAILREEACEEALEESYLGENSDFISLVDSYGGKKDDKKLAELVLFLHNFMTSSPWPLLWLEEKIELFNIEGKKLMDLPLLKSLGDDILNSLKSFQEPLEEALDVARNHEFIKGYEEALLSDMQIYMDFEVLLQKNPSFNEIREFLLEMSWKTLSRAKKGYDPHRADEVKNARKDFKGFFKALTDRYFLETEEENLRIIQETYPKLLALGKLTKLFTDKYTEKKREKNLLDFSDLEHLALEILTVKEGGEIKASVIAKAYKKKYTEVLVDEYQDSNEVQEVLISMVSRKEDEDPNVFMVGDVKQSIYRFRQAKPELFMDKYRTYAEEGNEKGRKILLYKNFRSRRNILSTVNFIFQGIMSQRVGELHYSEKESLIFGAEYYENLDEKIDEEDCADSIHGDSPVEIMLVEENGSASSEDEFSENEDIVVDLELDPSEYKAIEVEAKMVSERINSLLQEGFPVFDKKTQAMRPITYRDIVILMRATSRTANIFLEEFHQANIPSYSDSSTGYFDTIEIRTMMSLLKLIDNPLQDVPLLASLRSPIFSFNEEEMVIIRNVNREEFLYLNMQNIAGFQEPLQGKVGRFLEQLERFRKLSKYMKLDEFIWHLFTETAYFDYVGAMPDGIERQGNLKILFQRAKQFEDTSLKGLFNFIRFIDKLKKTTGDLGAAKILGENENLVRIMSIHKSKGLEFPVVFLVHASKRFNKMDLNREIILHETLGFGPNYVDLERGLVNTTLIKEVIKNKINLENISEEMRVLYVALTRAKEKLIISGQIKDLEKSYKKWTELSQGEELKVLEGKVEGASGYLDWIMAVLLKHHQLSGYRTDDRAYFHGKDVQVELNVQGKKEVLMESKSEDEKIKGTFTLDQLESPESSFEVNQRLSYRYPYEKDTLLSSKISVTELKRMANYIDSEEVTETLLMEETRDRPKFLMEKTGLTALEKGTAFHKIMQYIDFARSSLPEILIQFEELVARELIFKDEAQAVKPKTVSDFLLSSLGTRMRMADEVGLLKRETKFLMHKDESEVMVIGVIDSYFQEGDSIILVDYKTDYIESEYYEDILKNRYKEQLQYYQKALESITKIKVKEIYLYSTRFSKEISLI